MYEYNLGIRFQAIAEQHPGRTAIWFDDRTVSTFAELNSLANRLARLLVEYGVGQRDVVCISGQKSLHSFAYMIACLKIGAVYSILDPDSPPERLHKIMARCRPRILLAEPDFLKRLAEVTTELGINSAEKYSAEVADRISTLSDHNLGQTREVLGTNPAYIMFTSGSTGFPKGAVMSHANVLNLVRWSEEVFRITKDDILANVNPLYFDNSVFDFYSALFSGARLVPFTKDEVKDPRLLVDKVDAAACTLWFSVPSLLIFLQTMKATDGKNLKSIRRFVFGGEGYPKAKLKGLFDAYSSSSEIFNVYGPTECTCICSSYQVTAEDFSDLQGLPPLGRIADNFGFLILDEDGRPVPNGEIGELCLLGPNVGQGYYNDPERTAASFIQNPTNDHYKEIIYKTGDLVRLESADGKLYIHGRKDHQIKHMGYRIELEEIEAALNCLDEVDEAAVLHGTVKGLSRIVAIVSTRREIDRELMRHALKKIIPDYMIPSDFHREDALPKNSNGKVDRRFLAEKYFSPSAESQGASR